jgi:hypothetical protein
MHRRPTNPPLGTTGLAADGEAVLTVAERVALKVCRRTGSACAATAIAIMATAGPGSSLAQERDMWSTCAPVADRAGRALGC